MMSDALDVRVGDCLSELPGGSIFATEVETVSAVRGAWSKRMPARSMTASALRMGEFPGDEETAILAQEGCAERFGAFRRLVVRSGTLRDLAYLHLPARPGTSVTARWSASSSDPGGPLTDSPRGLGRAAAPAVGSCWDALGAEVDCAVAHDAEIYALVDLPGGAWPGQKALDAAAEPACLDQFGGYVGLAYDRSALDFAFVTPDEASWAAGDRLVGCVVVDPAGPLTGSVRGSGR